MTDEQIGGGPAATALADERTRIADYYRDRANPQVEGRYGPFNRGDLFRVQHLERDVLDALKRHRFTELSTLSVLDVGCGDGWFLRRLAACGANPALLAGVDLLPARITLARHLAPGIDLRCADATNLPWPDHAFDLVFQMGMFATIREEAMRRAVAAEMARVLKPGGAAVSYDFRVARDRQNTRPLKRSELASMFPGFGLDARRVTLVPPLARALAGRSWLACDLLEALPVLRTHDLVVLRRRVGSRQ